MRFFGDITKLKGDELPPVDVIVGGSPCQNFSIAGNRMGLDGSESRLFAEQIRIIKEMREHGCAGRPDRVFPRFAVWENVYGATSCNDGRDFQAVLTEFVRIVEPEAPDVPAPDKGWPSFGLLMGDGWSLCYRVHDAQYWGVPQRRRRISLVMDLAGRRAGEVQTLTESVRRDPETGRAERKGAAKRAEGGAGGAGEITYCLQGNGIDRPAVYGFRAQNGSKAGSIGYQPEQAPTIGAGQCGFMAPAVYDGRGNGDGAVACTITGDHQNRVTDYTNIVCAPKVSCIGNGQMCNITMQNLANSLDTMHDQQAVMITAVDCRNLNESEVSGTLQAKENGGQPLNYTNSVHISCFQNTGIGWWNQSDTAETVRTPTSGDGTKANLVRASSIVRRLTPVECERLQGFPDGWSESGVMADGTEKQMSDSTRYKLQGNSIALPYWTFLMRRISAEFEHTPTLGSLFDGQGGFPLIWGRINGPESVLWSSEIDKNAEAVVRKHFGDEDTGLKGDFYEAIQRQFVRY